MLLERERAAVVGACRELLAAGLLRGTSGNVSVRDPGSGLVAMTPSGVSYAEMTAAQVAVLSGAGEVLDAPLAPTSEAALHLAVLRARPDVNAVVHTHSPFATTFAALGEPVPAVHYLLAKAAPTVRVAPYARYGSAELASACVRVLADDHGVLLANHGVVAVGVDLRGAVAVAEAVESTAEIAWRARAVGRPVVLDGAEMSAVAAALATYGSPSPRPAATAEAGGG